MVVENALEGELNDHLGYPRNDPAGRAAHARGQPARRVRVRESTSRRAVPRRTAHRPGRATHVGTASLRAPAGTRKKARTFTAPLRLTSARIIGAGVNDVAVPARVEHGVGAGVGEIVRREVDPGRRGWWPPRCSCR